MMTHEQADKVWSDGNNAGNGYAPGGEMGVEDAVQAMTDAGATLVYRRQTTDDVAVVQRTDGVIVGVGDSHGAWCVDLGVGEWAIGDRVEAGDIAEDYDTGTIRGVRASTCWVAWDSGVRTEHPIALLRREGDRPVRDAEVQS